MPAPICSGCCCKKEAAETADPLGLMRLFGIKEAIVMHSVNVAHPERAVGLLR
ncbi:hypothetical protein ACFXKK_23495 [Streptomyces globisporus]|uniref:hypothetical protein n=1 Tax=Streptomyces globisporus TaxID=1908 RepID=UPI0036508C2A